MDVDWPGQAPRSSPVRALPLTRAAARAGKGLLARPLVNGQMGVFRTIEGRYDPHRRHSAPDYQSPVNIERKQLAAA